MAHFSKITRFTTWCSKFPCCMRMSACGCRYNTQRFKGSGRRFGMGAKPQGVWVTGVPSGVPGAEHRWGVWRRSSISHIFTYICLFFCACRHHSTKSVKWGAGHLISFAPPCLQMGATAHPALPPMLWLWLQYLIGPCQDG